MNNVNQNKGIGLDGVGGEMFKVGKCTKGEKIVDCEKCVKKMKFARSLMQPEYWEEEGSKIHLETRLVALNKAYPKIGRVDEYRPIVVSAPIRKFLEGYVLIGLKRYMKENKNLFQFGFTPNVSIEEEKWMIMN